MPEGSHPGRDQREDGPRAAHDLRRELKRVSIEALSLALGLALLSCVAASLGCDAGSRDNDGTTPPAVHVLGVKAIEEEGALIELGPSPTHTVASGTSFRVKVDRFLFPPEAAIRQSICVQADLRAVKTPDDCPMPVSFAVSYDPVTREVIYRLPPAGTSTGAIDLVAGGTYKMSFFEPTDDPASPGIRAFDGAALEHAPTFEFKVSKQPRSELDPPPTSKDTWCDRTVKPKASGALSILRGNCGLSGCHVNSLDRQGNVSFAAMDLQFNTAGIATEQTIDVIRRTAVNHVAHETQIGENGSTVEATTNRFGRAMPIIAPGAAGNSYLLYKLLIGVDSDTKEPFIADDAERQRLRDAFVIADPMPLPNAPGAAASAKMTAAGLETLSLWIQADAGFPACK